MLPALPFFRARAAGFTLLEMCIVLVILAILAGAAMPSIQSALEEQGLRQEGGQIALLVKTGMLRSSEENRAYRLDLSGRDVVLVPVAEEKKAHGEDAPEDPTPLDPADRILLPNPDKPGAWKPLQASSWSFQPDELCPVPRLRLERGRAWMEMSFNALTGNVEDESLYAP
jgi:prepilin-type N-terminal cleavage/methylation domain-containing protein